MHLSPQAQAVMLLTVSFGKSDTSKAKPLSTNEWGRFAVWLKDHDLEPASLLKGDLQDLLSGWIDRSITLSRLADLLDRGGALGLVLEKWQRAGLWIVTRSDPDYPERLKRRLRLESPPVLFGCGNKMLLDRGGIAVVGSRDANQDDLAFTENFGNDAAKQGYSIVSGGARGVDQSAMLGALQNEGTAVGVLADSLLRSATSAKYRKHLLSGDLVLICPFNPEAGFNVGNAMSRNRYIYCLADAAVVISSTTNKGGTWNGALEDLKAGWIPLWVKRSLDARSGNAELVNRGAQWLPERLNSLSSLLNGSQVSSSKDAPSNDLPLLAEKAQSSETAATEPAIQAPAPADSETATAPLQLEESQKLSAESAIRSDIDFYDLFLVRLAELTSDAPLPAEQIAERINVAKVQVNAWLKRGVSDNKVRKLTKPARYQFAPDKNKQASLF